MPVGGEVCSGGFDAARDGALAVWAERSAGPCRGVALRRGLAGCGVDADVFWLDAPDFTSGSGAARTRMRTVPT